MILFAFVILFAIYVNRIRFCVLICFSYDLICFHVLLFAFYVLLFVFYVLLLAIYKLIFNLSVLACINNFMLACID